MLGGILAKLSMQCTYWKETSNLFKWVEMRWSKRRNVSANLIAVTVSVLIIALGIWTPIVLLNAKEQSVLGDTQRHQSLQQAPVSIPKPKPTSDPIALERFFQRCYLWETASSAPTVRETDASVLTKEQALQKAEEGLSDLMDVDAIPQLDTSDWTLKEAQLLAIHAAMEGASMQLDDGLNRQSSVSRWKLAFESSKQQQVRLELDATSGKILSINMSGPDVALSASNQEAFVQFARYLGVFKIGLTVMCDVHSFTCDLCTIYLKTGQDGETGTFHLFVYSNQATFHNLDATPVPNAHTEGLQ